MKGQFIIIIVAFILLRNSLSIFDTLSEKRFVESSLVNKQAKNILSEYEYLSGVASLQSNVNRSAIDYLYNFSTFLRNERSIEILYVFVYMNDSNDRYSVTVGNFLNDNINITVNASTSSPGQVSFLINDKKNTTSHFSATISGTINITLTQKRIDTITTERFTIDSRKNMTASFFDLTLIENTEIRVKSVYNVTI